MPAAGLSFQALHSPGSVPKKKELCTQKTLHLPSSALEVVEGRQDAITIRLPREKFGTKEGKRSEMDHKETLGSPGSLCFSYKCQLFES